MTPARWRDIARICDSALSIDPEARASFLDRECAGDALLREEVASLLAYEEAAQQFSGALALDVAAAALASGELPAAERFAPGSLIGPYRITELLGAGGMGEVYRATDTRLDRDVALKFLPAELTNDAPALGRFQREARAVSALNHANICTLHDIGAHENQPFLVLELLEGESLKQRLAAGPLTAGEAIETAVQICRALEAAHAKGIVHRDVKPANVFITRGGQAKILDFGLAKLHAEPPGSAVGRAAAGEAGASEATVTLPGRAMGTAAYMSPEQARGEPVDARSDLFSLGATLYQMATGTLPFRGAAPAGAAEAILSERPRPPRELNPALPAGLQRVILKALEKDRTARYQSAADICADLERMRPAAGRAAWKPLAIGAALLLGAIFILGAAWIILAPSRAPEPYVRPLTASPGIERFPTFSPDGKHVAFLWNGEQQDQFDLYRMPVDGGSPEQLTNDANSECYAAWSPDGRSIAFVHCSPETSDSMRQTMSEVWMLDIATRKKRRIGDVYTPLNPGTPMLAWTGDSRRLIIEDKSSIAELNGMFLLDVESGQKERLTAPPPDCHGDRSPSVSPDGRTLAFVRVATFAVSNVYLMDLAQDRPAGSEPRPLTGGKDNITDIMWTGDGREIIYAADRKGIRGLWRISASGGRQPRVIPSVAQIGVDITVARQGRLLAYSESFSDDDIWRLDLSDPADHAGQPLILSNRQDQNPQISPDGRLIAFDSERTGNSEIWVCDTDGSHAHQVTSLGHTAGTPRWSPDGTKLAFDCRVEGNDDIYVVIARGGEPCRLTVEPSSENVPSWSRDGKWIYFSSNRNGSRQVWKLPAGGGKPVQITADGGFGGFESIDGGFFFYAKTSARPTSLWRVPAWGGEEIEIFSGLKSWANFAVLGNGIYFRPEDPAPNGFWVQFYDFRTKRVSTVREVNNRAGTGLAVEPGARWMVFSVKAFRGGDLFLVDGFL